MMRTGHAAVYEAPNTPFVLKEFPVRPAKRGEVLVRVTMSTICRSDIHSYEGRRPNPCPGILGHEIIGVIEELGEGVDKDMRGDPLEVGDRITWSEYFFDGQCYYRDVLDMPQKCHGVRKYGHDLARRGSALPRWICRVLLYPARHLYPQAARRTERRGSNAAQLRRRHHGICDRGRRNRPGRRGGHPGSRSARSLRRRDGQGARRALRDRSRCGGEPARRRQKIRRRSRHRYRPRPAQRPSSTRSGSCAGPRAPTP